MGAKSKSGKRRGVTQKRAGRPPLSRGTARVSDPWEQTAQAQDEVYDEIDCQRIVQGDGRSLPLYYDDYN